ncbi:RAMP superfamily CRISPR-associated protein [Allochromatium palmeri]|uniref:CRISPR system Cms protein Csm5 n=1 Tax=Allochromatium palmeri TaxID=231048 RepID=A0A6N8ECM4_9GAMM|nr:RAMP superfamily CRISPR-associated protein [Allochromatium palmeri]MTW21321.1 CRISPR-associated protein Csm5 [Allochromatium palmeri]
MSHGFSTWQLAITPLSPVHIGTGEDYEPTQYVIDGDGLYSFSPEAALRALPEAARADLLRILNGPPTVELLKQVQAFFHRQAERLIPEAEHVIPVLPTIAAEYAERVGKTAQRERERDIINQLRIMRTYGDAATRRPILPGSSLKGAIRTALLDRVNGGASLPPDIKRLPEHKRNVPLQKHLFGYDNFDQDPMRLVQLGDAADVRPSETLGTEIRYAVNRKRQPVTKDGREIAAQAENLRQVVECIPLLRPRAFQGQLSLQELGGLTGPKLPAPELRWTFEELAEACQAFYRPILERELQELGSRGYLDAGWRAAIRQILEAQEHAFSARRAFLLRVGFHSGAESVTLNGVRSIKINMGRDPQTGRTRYEDLPVTKTVWLAAQDIQQRRDLVPFGWVLVEAIPHDQAFADWPVGLTEQGVNEASDEANWRGGIETRRRELRERLDAERARDQAQREATERQVREEAERAARLATLSEQGRQLEGLRTRLEQDRRANLRQAGGELANRLVAVLKEAAESWPAEDCVALADLAEEIYGYIGWPTSKKKRERQAQIQALRQRS